MLISVAEETCAEYIDSWAEIEESMKKNRLFCE